MVERIDYLSENYKGVDINVHYDTYPDNPFDVFDILYPTIVDTGGWVPNVTDYSNGDILEYLTSFLTKGRIKLHQNKLIDMMDDDLSYYEFENFNQKYEYIVDLVVEWITNCPANMAKFCELFKIKHLYTQSKGYSQGDCADVFCCWTPQFEQITGVTYKKSSVEGMQETVDMWGAWAWGNVYRIVCDEVDENCSGFYGDSDAKDGINEMISLIDDKIESDVKKYIERSKTLLKNHVPYNTRKKLLDELKSNLILPAQKLI